MFVFQRKCCYSSNLGNVSTTQIRLTKDFSFTQNIYKQYQLTIVVPCSFLLGLLMLNKFLSSSLRFRCNFSISSTLILALARPTSTFVAKIWPKIGQKTRKTHTSLLISPLRFTFSRDSSFLKGRFHTKELLTSRGQSSIPWSQRVHLLILCQIGLVSKLKARKFEKAPNFKERIREKSPK